MPNASRRTKPLPPRWNKVRAAVLHRNPTCQINGPRCEGPATEVDHIIPASAGGDDSLSNLQAVCASCHASKTAREANEARSKWSRRLPAEPHPGAL